VVGGQRTCTHAAQRYMGSGNTLTMFGLPGPATPQQILNSFIHVGYGLDGSTVLDRALGSLVPRGVPSN
jgi:hypothetical protein